MSAVFIACKICIVQTVRRFLRFYYLLGMCSITSKIINKMLGNGTVRAMKPKDM